MRLMKRNKRRFYYALYAGKEFPKDARGRITGEPVILYGTPKAAYGVLSGAKGEAGAEAFGGDLLYDRVLVMEKGAPVFDEYTVLYLDRPPEISPEGICDTPYDTVIVRAAESLNHRTYALRRVEKR